MDSESNSITAQQSLDDLEAMLPNYMKVTSWEHDVHKKCGLIVYTNRDHFGHIPIKTSYAWIDNQWKMYSWNYLYNNEKVFGWHGLHDIQCHQHKQLLKALTSGALNLYIDYIFLETIRYGHLSILNRLQALDAPF